MKITYYKNTETLFFDSSSTLKKNKKINLHHRLHETELRQLKAKILSLSNSFSCFHSDQAFKANVGFPSILCLFNVVNMDSDFPSNKNTLLFSHSHCRELKRQKIQLRNIV